MPHDWHVEYQTTVIQQMIYARLDSGE